MEKISDRDSKYIRMAKNLNWNSLRKLWDDIRHDNTSPDWDPGKAFEHFVLRALELSRLTVKYPFNVPLYGQTVEPRSTGCVFLDNIPFLIECKDKDSVDISAIAKLHLHSFYAGRPQRSAAYSLRAILLNPRCFLPIFRGTSTDNFVVRPRYSNCT